MESNFKSINQKQKKFLINYGLNPEDFLSVSIAYDHYIFYHIKSKKEVSLRR